MMVTMTLLSAGTALVGCMAPGVAGSTSGDASLGCRNGVAGIEDIDKGVCCVKECGQCGGEGCASAGGLTGAQCCTTDIISLGESCKTTQQAPCLTYTPSKCSNGLDGVEGQNVCCAEVCNQQCGGTGCGNIPGTEGSSDCCSSFIMDKGIRCGQGVTAPCIIAGESSRVSTPSPESLIPGPSLPTTPAPTLLVRSGPTPPTANPNDVVPTPSPAMAESPRRTPPSGTSPLVTSSSTSKDFGLIVGGAAAGGLIFLVILGVCLHKRGMLIVRRKKRVRHLDCPDDLRDTESTGPSASIIHPSSTKSDDLWPPRPTTVTARSSDKLIDSSETGATTTPSRSPGHNPSFQGTVGNLSPSDGVSPGAQSRTSGRSDSASTLAISAPSAIANSTALVSGESDAASKKVSARRPRGNNRFVPGTVGAITNSPAFRKTATLSHSEGDSDVGSRYLPANGFGRKRNSFNRGTIEAIANSSVYQNPAGLAGADGDSDCESRNLSVRGPDKKGGNFTIRPAADSIASPPAATPSVVVIVAGGERGAKRASLCSERDEIHSPASSTMHNLDCGETGSPGKFRPMRASSDVSSIRSPGCDEQRWDSASFCASDFAGSD